MEGLGKPLRNSAFIQESDEDSIFNVISHGRPPEDPANTTRVAMPPRGLQNINDDQIHLVIAYIRSLQDPAQPTASLDAWIAPPLEESNASSTAMDTSTFQGHDIFVASCSACHGSNGEGMEGLGKPLSTSEFVASKSDKDLATFIKTGRPMWDEANTTGVDMPPKGGNPAMSDDDLTNIIAFIRAVQEGASASSPTTGSAAQAQVDTSAFPGHDIFVSSCSACHGVNGEGMEGLGKPLNTSEFIGSKSDKDLATFIKTGRPMWDEDNTTGVDMPPKGGNPALSDDDITQIIAFIRAVHTEK